MRIALLQIRVLSDSRSANLAHVLRQVVRAAETVPAPDLLVLPASCDGINPKGVTAAMAQGFGESLAAAAREWGLYVAAGALRAVDDGVYDQACLYDPDGDVIACSATDSKPPVRTVFETALGQVWIGTEGGDALLEAPEEPCDLLLLHGRWTAPQGKATKADERWRNRLAEIARRTGAVVCAAGAVSDVQGQCDPELLGGSALFDPSGQCVVAAQPGVEETVVGEAAVPAARGAG